MMVAVRAADEDTLIIANGFSCREQIAQTTNRQGLHLAEVIQMALHESGSKLPEVTPETKKIASAGSFPASPRAAAIAASIVGVLLAAVFFWQRGRRKQG